VELRRSVVAAVAWLCCAAVFVLWAPFDVAAEAGLGSWTFDSRERGITVSKRESNGETLSAFRGDGIVHAHALQVLAVILDVREIERWAYGVTSARSVRHIDDRTEIVYLYSNTPWPVRDRDMVVRRKVSVIKPGEEFAISFRCEPSAAQPRAGVIRVRDCESSFRVRKIDAENTAVVYEMSLDPEGRVPQWASAWVARTAPVKTLLAIESRAARSQDRYAAFVQSWSNAL
jgi:START domain